MKVRFVLCHPAHGLLGEEREVFLATALRRLGRDAAYFAISNRNSRESRRHAGFDCPIELFPPDDPTTVPHRTTSAALLAALRGDNPDMVLVKGIDYRQAAAIFETLPREKLGVIIGGRSSHPLLEKARIIYFESNIQKEHYMGSANSIILPKYINWEELGNIYDTEKRFDIINVGNFNEARKSQEFLFPLANRHTIAFVGGGSRLEAFKRIARRNNNITFAGFVDRRTVFAWLKAARLMVHASTWDGYPRAVAESLAAGVPVIGLEGVLDGITREPFVRCTSVENLSAFAAHSLRAPEDLLRLGKDAHQYMSRVSSYEALLKAFLDLLPAA